MSEKTDIDYLYISSRVKAMEKDLLTKERMNKMLEARTNEEAAKVLTECGYGDFTIPVTASEVEEKLSQQRSKLYSDLSVDVPDIRLVDIFRIRFDYHNIKVLLKAKDMEAAERLFIDAGRIAVETMKNVLNQMDMREIPMGMTEAIYQAKEVLSQTGNPQKADFLLDKACYQEMLDLAEASGSLFLVNFVKINIDAINLRSAVRSVRMNKSIEFIRSVMLPGGNVPEENIVQGAVSGSGLETAFAATELRDAAAAGVKILKTGRMTEFEKLCDDAIMSFLDGAKYKAFGPETAVGYIYAKEAEFSAARIIMMGRLSGLEAETIKERLREAYV